MTGNTVIDALLFGIEKVNANFIDPEIEQLKEILDFQKKIILVTGHRRENHGARIIKYLFGIKNHCKKS